MTALAHTVRNSLIDRERTFTLGPDALHWSERGREGEVPYADIRSMRLISYAGFDGAQLQCTLRTHKHGTIKIRSHHYASLANFEDRSATYAPFVRALAARVAEKAPEAEFIAGSTGLWLVWLAVAALFVLAFVALVVALAEGIAPTLKAFIFVGLCLAAIPLAWRQIRQGAADTFDPAAPPADLLGAP